MTEISRPEFARGIGGFTFNWDSLSCRVVVERLSDEGTGEISVYHMGGVKRLLHRSKENLLSTRSLSTLAKRLSQNLPLDWDTVLTYVSTMSVDAMRDGDPVVMLTKDFGKSAPEYLLHPLFVRDAVNIIYADKGSGKSTFVILVDLILSFSWTEKPLGLNVTPETSHSVLFLDWENNDKIVGWQKECLLRGMNWPDCDIAYRHCSLPLASDVGQIQRKIAEANADTIIIDSLGMAVGDDLNLTKPAFTFLSALRSLPVTPILIGHTSKDQTSKRKSVYGNAFYENEARSIWEVCKNQEQGSNEMTMTLFHRKSPPFSGLHDPMGFRFIFEDNKTLVESTSPHMDKRDPTKPTAKETVLAILQESAKPLLPKDIIALAGGTVTSDDVYVALNGLRKPDRITKRPTIQKTDAGYSVLTSS